MKIQSFKTVTNISHLRKWEKSKLTSIVIEEILKITYPKYSKLLPLKKKKLHLSIFNYLFDGEEAMFSEIEEMTNVVFACNLKGYQFLIEKNQLKSFEELDEFMNIKKEKSFEVLNQSFSSSQPSDKPNTLHFDQTRWSVSSDPYGA